MLEAGKGEERPWQVDREGNRERERERKRVSLSHRSHQNYIPKRWLTSMINFLPTNKVLITIFYF